MNVSTLSRFLVPGALVWVCFAAAASAKADVYADKVDGFAKKYCHACHNAKQAKGGLDLTQFAADGDVVKEFRRWQGVVAFLRKGEMPPSDRPQPTLDERNDAIAAVEQILLVEARKHAGDPGSIRPRRLSNTELEHSLHDLTGVRIRATAEFPVDPAGGEGFDNTGEALGMTPTLLSKYLGAAQFASEHLVLKPGGIQFAPYPVRSYNERKKLTEQAIIDFYRNHEVDIPKYIDAAYRYRYRGEPDRGLRLEEWAARHQLSGRYLTLVAKTLDEAKAEVGHVGRLGTLWQALPAPAASGAAPKEYQEFQRFFDFVRDQLKRQDPPRIRPGAGTWPIEQLAMRAKVAAERDTFNKAQWKARRQVVSAPLQVKSGQASETVTLTLRIDLAIDDAPPGLVIVHSPLFSKSDKAPANKKDAESQGVETLRSVLEREAPAESRRLGFGKHPRGGELDADSFAVQAPATVEISLPAAAVEQLKGKRLLIDCELDAKATPEAAAAVQVAIGKIPESSRGTEILLRPESQLAKALTKGAERFCATFPNAFFYVDKNRGLAAGFHLVEGFFRDDQPLVGKVLSDAERQELDRLWRELDFVTESAETLLRGFVWFERAERHVLHDKRFDLIRSEDPLLVEEKLLSKFERLYLERLGVKLVPDELKPAAASSQFDLIHGFFEQVRAGLAEHKRTLKAAESAALADIERLAERAYSRPLRPDEARALRGLYQKLREQGQDVENSVRGTFAAILMSPHFFYRVPTAAAGGGIHPLSDEALARRLSYFLWSTLPDAELLAAARAGKLQDEATLRTQVRRMLKSPKIEAFAREFFGQWLRYRDYLAKDPIPPKMFAGYDAELRQAMFEEPTRMVAHLLQTDRPIDELLHGDATFVNEALAKYYGGTIETQFRRQLADRLANKDKNAAADRKDLWFRVEGLKSMGRGGLVGMPVILAKNSVGQRTSPVKRGFWVVHHLLGQHFPPPPADVPELPKSEKESAKTIREMLASHASQRQCAMCHVHFDGLGLTMEGFDAVGKARTKDLAGREISAVGPLPGGKSAEGIPALIAYLEKERLHEFDRNLSRKLLGYALSRSVVLSDEPFLRELGDTLRTDRKFSTLIEEIVLSPQFRRQRGLEFTAAER